MKSKVFGVVILVVLLVLAFGTVGQAFAGGSAEKVVDDAADGTIDGDWTSAQIQAALDYLQNNPISLQYSDTEGVLEDYLSSLQAPGASEGELAFTGGEVFLPLLLGLGLIGGGLVLRRRSPA